MDIRSKLDYPAGALTNFFPYSFVFDGVLCASMEGLLQAFKTNDVALQIQTCQLVGIVAKEWGNEYNVQWKEEQALRWQGKRYDRHSADYQSLLDRAYDALYQNKDFREALIATGEEELTHSIGKSDPHDTILTEIEFCSRLMKLRNRAK